MTQHCAWHMMSTNYMLLSHDHLFHENQSQRALERDTALRNQMNQNVRCSDICGPPICAAVEF